MACSFCNSYTHNITTCRDPEIEQIYQRIKNIYLDIAMRQYINDEENMFRTELARLFNLRQLRGVAIRYARSSVASKGVMIKRIYNYFKRSIIIPQNGEQWLTRRIPTQTYDILWYMDTSPDIVQTDIQNIMNQLNFIGRLDEFLPTQTQTQIETQKFDIIPILEEQLLQPQKEKTYECSICYENLHNEDIVKLNCNHEFCGKCIKESLKLHNNKHLGPNCALCRELITAFYVKKTDIYNSIAEHCNKI